MTFIFYSKDDSSEVLKVLELLNVYVKAIGQRVNNGKSPIFFSSNVIQYKRQNICQTLHMIEAYEQSKCLGLPNVIGRNKLAILGFFKEKIYSKLRSWDDKHVSKSGKEVLVKSIVQALPAYVMSVFQLPLGITRDIERSLSKFWWNSTQTNSFQISWVSWLRKAKHKCAGGLGLRHFLDFNLAMLGKQGWRFMINSESWSCSYKKRVGNDFLNSALGHNPSFIWRSIFEA